MLTTPAPKDCSVQTGACTFYYPAKFLFSSSLIQQDAVSEGSDDSGSDTERGRKEGKSWIKSIGRRKSGSNTNSRSRSRTNGRRKGRTGRGSGGEGGSSDDSDRPLTSGSSEDGEEDGDKAEDEYDGLLLGKMARCVTGKQTVE